MPELEKFLGTREKLAEFYSRAVTLLNIYKPSKLVGLAWLFRQLGGEAESVAFDFLREGHSSPIEILDELKFVFLDRSDVNHKIDRLFTRKQGDKESVLDYSRALLKLHFEINFKHPDLLPLGHIIHHFMNKLHSKSVRKSVKKRM